MTTQQDSKIPLKYANPPPAKIFNSDGDLRTVRSRTSDSKGDRVINWLIQNMPEGKQTIVILWRRRVIFVELCRFLNIRNRELWLFLPVGHMRKLWINSHSEKRVEILPGNQTDSLFRLGIGTALKFVESLDLLPLFPHRTKCTFLVVKGIRSDLHGLVSLHHDSHLSIKVERAGQNWERVVAHGVLEQYLGSEWFACRKLSIPEVLHDASWF